MTREMNGHIVKEAKAPLYKQKVEKGFHPYELGDKKIKVTLVKSPIACLKDQQQTVKALGLTKIRSFKISMCDLIIFKSSGLNNTTLIFDI